MSAGPTWPLLAVKEIRALLPVWLACMFAVMAGVASGRSEVLGGSVLAYAVGSIVLGALALGHEYNHGTLGLLLAQPVRRSRILLTKLTVLALMLLALTLIVWSIVSTDQGFVRASTWLGRPVLIVAALLGLSVAPWLTMLSRSTLGGIVFTAVVPGLLLVAAEVIAGPVLELQSAAAVDEFKRTFFWRGVMFVCAASTAGTWITFTRLEAIEGRGADIQLSSWPGAPSGTASRVQRPAPRHPIAQLLRKELRLQQMTVVVAVLYIAGWLTMTTLERLDPEAHEMPITAITILYLGLLALLVGAQASAEERQLGTLDSQLLLPIAPWKQWLVKAGTALTLAWTLGVALPVVLSLFAPATESTLAPRAWLDVSAVLLLLTSVSLYVSSLSTSGVKALVASLPIVVGGVFLIPVISGGLWRIAARLFPTPRHPILVAISISDGFSLLAIGLFVCLLLWLAFANHRQRDRSVGRLALQGLAIGGFIVATLTVPIVLLFV